MEDLEARPQSARLFAEAKAILFPGHDDVGQQQIDLLVALQNPQCDVAVASVDHLVALPHEVGIEQFPHRGIVFDNEDTSRRSHS